jgi:hypothetical protein
MSQEGAGFEAEKWQEVSGIYRRMMGHALECKNGKAAVEMEVDVEKEGLDSAPNLPEIGMMGMLGYRVRYFTDGAVIGSREFVNEAFSSARERFGPKRRDGARRMRGDAAPAGVLLWSLRDLKKRI